MNLVLTFEQAVWFFPVVAPIALFVAWSDLKYMRISNRVVMILGAAFLLIGWFPLGFEDYLWRLAQFLVVFALGFLVNALGLVGGGDAKYTAVLAPFVAFGDARAVLLMFAAILIAALLTHRLFKISPLRNLVPDWKSWDAGNKFPMGLALSGTIIVYLALGLTPT